MAFIYETRIRAEWIDYNGHMQDAYYGLVFSYAVDALQDEVGFDAAYRAETGCTIYLLEDHKFYLREVLEGDLVRVETQVLDADEKRFHLHLVMSANGDAVAVGEFMELHVQQTPKPHAVPMPDKCLRRLMAAKSQSHEVPLKRRARAMGLFGS